MRPPYPGESRYRLLARSLREAILEDRFAEGQPLPTEATLAATFSLSRQTVRRAFLELVSEGLVFRVPGRGTFVTPKDSRYRRRFSSVEDLMNLTLDTELEVIEPLTGTFDEEVAERLQLTGRSMYSVLFRRLHRGEIFCTTRVLLPAAVGSTLDTLPELVEAGHRSGITIIGLLESRGARIAEAEQVTTAVAASDRQAELLGCTPGAPLLHIERLYIDVAGVPVELAISDYLPEHYSHRLRLGRGGSEAP
ncbi:GntR family transcriptional regulator [Nocardioides iriomotensis]|uniref:GntR family transcriptional regulator n=2 Tax=Nocardioides iriomotensis TaxID=715784 RepID=A0A4Q5J5J2_9ACTN|nr:GntR family transcriptional regulator [Nocardioides iriomotensis]